MNNPKPSFEKGLHAVLSSITDSADRERRAGSAFQAMASSQSIGQVVRRVSSANTQTVLDAFDVLQGLGLDGTTQLYAYLSELPHRFRLHENAFQAETSAGCVDRAVEKVTEEILVAAGAAVRPVGGISQQAADAALTANVDERTAQEVLVVSALADSGKRIQRLSVDTREITSRIVAEHPGLPEEVLRATVRLVLTTASQIVHEADGIDVG